MPRATRKHLPWTKKTCYRCPELKAANMEEISALLLHQSIEAQRKLKLAPEGRSIKINWLRYGREALPLLMGANPSHLVFTEELLPDGTWRDVVKVALHQALNPVEVIVVSRLIDVRL